MRREKQRPEYAFAIVQAEVNTPPGCWPSGCCGVEVFVRSKHT